VRTSEDGLDSSDPRCAAIDDQTARSAQNAETLRLVVSVFGRWARAVTRWRICAIRAEMRVLTGLPNVTNVAHALQKYAERFSKRFPPGLVARSEITP
jgi:hypothetical protein